MLSISIIDYLLFVKYIYMSCSEEFQGISFFLYNYETQKLKKVFM